MSEQPTAAEIGYFVAKCRETDSNWAINNYIRYGHVNPPESRPDATVVKVLKWLDGLSQDGKDR